MTSTPARRIEFASAFKEPVFVLSPSTFVLLMVADHTCRAKLTSKSCSFSDNLVGQRFLSVASKKHGSKTVVAVTMVSSPDARVLFASALANTGICSHLQEQWQCTLRYRLVKPAHQ